MSGLFFTEIQYICIWRQTAEIKSSLKVCLLQYHEASVFVGELPWKQGDQRPILNFPPRGKVVTQEWIWSPRGEVSLGVEFSVCFSILLNSGECSSLGLQGEHSPLGNKFHPWGSSTPLEVKFTPGGPGVKSRMAFRWMTRSPVSGFWTSGRKGSSAFSGGLVMQLPFPFGGLEQK
jgi:hypothetical protein